MLVLIVTREVFQVPSVMGRKYISLRKNKSLDCGYMRVNISSISFTYIMFGKLFRVNFSCLIWKWEVNRTAAFWNNYGPPKSKYSINTLSTDAWCRIHTRLMLPFIIVSHQWVYMFISSLDHEELGIFWMWWWMPKGVPKEILHQWCSKHPFQFQMPHFTVTHMMRNLVPPKDDKILILER